MSINAQSVLPEFQYIKPKSLEEASQFLADHTGEARPFLGGTDTFVRMRDGVWKDTYLVDVKGLDGTGELKYSASKGLTIGAGVSMNQVSAFPDVKEHFLLLAEVVDTVASYQLRTRATIIGNICNASPAGDTIGVCILYGGILTVHGVNGIRQEPLDSFFIGPGKTVLQPGDIVTALELPPQPKGFVGTYLKHGRNKLGDLAIVGVTVVAYPDGETKSGYRIKLALASVAPTPIIIEQVETILADEVTELRIAEAAQAAMDACNPIDDVRSSARYRKMMVRNLSQKALSEVWAKFQNN